VRLAIISDIHEDIESLKKIVSKAEDEGYDKLICLGDISGYSMPYYSYEDVRDARACLSLIREKCDIIIAGNHDLHAAGISPDIPYELEGEESWPHEQDLDPGYTPSDIDFLSTLPSKVVLKTPDQDILFTHYAYPNLSGFMKGFYSQERHFDPHFAFMKEHRCSLAFMGHVHPNGFYLVHLNGYRHYRFRDMKISASPSLVGVPPVARNSHQSGFCIFETKSKNLQAIR
jgi:predicted phosphodiesterase